MSGTRTKDEENRAFYEKASKGKFDSEEERDFYYRTGARLIKGNSLHVIALFDILGFREYLQRTPLDQVVSTVNNLDSMILRAVPVVFPTDFDGVPIKGTPGRQVCGHIRFSDTILLYRRLRSAWDFDFLFSAALAVLVESLLLGIPLRGAITSGELHVSKDRQTFVGKGLVRAYDLEQAQEWVGAIVDSDMDITPYMRSISRDGAKITGDLLDYEVPLKRGVVAKYDALGWPNYVAGTSEEIRRRLMEFAGAPAWPARAKIRNTIEFLAAHRELYGVPTKSGYD